MQRWGVEGTELDGIFFTESMAPPGARVLGPIRSQKNRQNSNLAEVKQLLASEAKRVGANAVCSYKYGQKAHKWWELSLSFKWDSESWHADGVAVWFD